MTKLTQTQSPPGIVASRARGRGDRPAGAEAVPRAPRGRKIKGLASKVRTSRLATYIALPHSAAPLLGTLTVRGARRGNTWHCILHAMQITGSH